MKKRFLLLAVVITGIYLVFCFSKSACPLKSAPKIERASNNEQEKASIEGALTLLKNRQDSAALVIFEEILGRQPDNIDALWGKAEVLRRSRDYKQAEVILNKILGSNPRHSPSLISLAYIRYKDDRLDQAIRLVKQVLANKPLNKQDQALAYMMLGAINSRRSGKGWFLNKLVYGTQIKGYFLKAKDLSPDLPEVHLGLGTFYLLAPAIAGGNIDKAVDELGLAVRLAPDFATANARLAVAYKKKGDLEKYRFYLNKAKQLDPRIEALRENE